MCLHDCSIRVVSHYLSSTKIQMLEYGPDRYDVISGNMSGSGGHHHQSSWMQHTSPMLRDQRKTLDIAGT